MKISTLFTEIFTEELKNDKQYLPSKYDHHKLFDIGLVANSDINLWWKNFHKKAYARLSPQERYERRELFKELLNR